MEYMTKKAYDVRYEHFPILQPSSLGIVDGRKDEFPVLIKQKVPLTLENYLILGCMHKAKMFKDLQGFGDYPLLEDWDYWLRAEETAISSIFGARSYI